MSTMLTRLANKVFSSEREVYNTTGQMELDKLSPGYPNPSTLTTIKEIVMRSEAFIVTIDDELSINWTANDKYTDYAKDFSAVTSKVQLLSMQVNQLFARKEDRHMYKRIIAEAMALVLYEKKSGNALALLKDAEERILEHGKERTRMAYLYYTFIAALFAGLLLCATLELRNINWFFVGDINRYQITIATLLGGIGAFVSAFIRFRNYEGSTSAGLAIHRLDGLLRIVYGCIAGLILTLAIYSNTFLGFLNTASVNQPWVIYFFAAMAGASEFLVPNLIKPTVTKSLFSNTAEEDNRERVTEKTILLYKNGDNSRNGEKQKEETRQTEETLDKSSGYFTQGKMNLRD